MLEQNEIFQVHFLSSTNELSECLFTYIKPIYLTTVSFTLNYTTLCIFVLRFTVVCFLFLGSRTNVQMELFIVL